MIGIGGEQFAQDRCILPDASTTSLVIQELDPVDVFEDALMVRCHRCQINFSDGVATPVCLHQMMGILLVFVGDAIAKFILQGFAYHIEISVLTKNRRNEEPVICCSHSS